MIDEMSNKNKIPDNWWNNNNKINFTLPYTKKSLLQRAIVRSNISNIKENLVYPFGGIIVMGAYEKHVGIHNQSDLNLHQKFMKNDIFIEYRLLGNKKGWSKNDKKCRIAIIE